MRDEASLLKLIWFALLMSIVMYGVIAYLIVPIGANPFDAAFANPLILALNIAGLGMFAMSFVVSSVFLKSGAVRGAWIIRWAMIEGTAVFGLVAALLGQDVRLFLPLGLLALAAMVLAYPRR